jgi:metal-responsive CopG/Arc/MetJ family transcriptional regulator
MHKILISISDDLAYRLKGTIPQRQRSKIIAKLLSEEINRREKALYNCALEVEKNETLNHEMQDWDVTINDGLEKLDDE